MKVPVDKIIVFVGIILSFLALFSSISNKIDGLGVFSIALLIIFFFFVAYYKKVKNDELPNSGNGDGYTYSKNTSNNIEDAISFLAEKVQDIEIKTIVKFLPSFIENLNKNSENLNQLNTEQIAQLKLRVEALSENIRIAEKRQHSPEYSREPPLKQKKNLKS